MRSPKAIREQVQTWQERTHRAACALSLEKHATTAPDLFERRIEYEKLAAVNRAMLDVLRFIDGETR